MAIKKASVYLGLFVVACSVWISNPAWAQAKEDAQAAAQPSAAAPQPSVPGEDPVAQKQSLDAFTSIEDGQPGGPGTWELQLDLGWDRYSHDYQPFPLAPELKYTGLGNRFLENMELSLAVPLELGEGKVEGNGDVELGWQQRWVAEHGAWPSLATLLRLRLPSGVDSSGVDATLYGILDKDLGPGTVYASTWITALGGGEENERDYQWGIQAGYKWQVNEKLALFANYVHETSEDEDVDASDVLEAGAEYRATDHLTIGPGVRFGLGNNDDDREKFLGIPVGSEVTPEQPDFGVGIRFNYAF